MRRQLDKPRLVRASVGLGLISIIASVLSFLREVTIAILFGATALTDAYLIAFMVTDFVRYAVAEGPFKVLGLPHLSKALNRSLPEGERVFRHLGAVLLIFLLAASVILSLCAESIVAIIGGQLDIQTQRSASLFLRILAVAVIFIGWNAFLNTAANALHNFLTPSILNLSQNLFILAFIAIFAQNIGLSALPVGIAIASILTTLYLVFHLSRRLNFRVGLKWSPRSAEIKALWFGFTPALIGTSFIHFDLFIDRFYLAGLSEGSISAYSYAHKIVLLATLIFMSGMGVFFTAMSDAAATDAHDRFAGILQFCLQTIMAGLLPASIFVFQFSELIIRVVFQRGAFGEQATLMTAHILQVLSLGFIPFVAFAAISRALYALGDVRTPMWVGIGYLAIKFTILQFLIGSFGARGIALSTILAFSMASIFSFHMIWRASAARTRLDWMPMIVTTVASGLTMGIACWFASSSLRTLFPTNSIGNVGLLSTLGLTAIIVYISSAMVFKAPWFAPIKGAVSRKLARE